MTLNIDGGGAFLFFVNCLVFGYFSEKFQKVHSPGPK